MSKQDFLMDETVERIIGARVILRPFDESDITPRYLSWLVDDEVNRFSKRFGQAEQRAEDVRVWLTALKADEKVYAIHTIDYGHIGNIKYGPITWSNFEADISILIGEVASWGKGYGAEATYLVAKHLFIDRKINRLSAGSINPAFIRMVQKLGWRREGIQRERFLVDGMFHDAVLLSLLRREFDIIAAFEATNQ